jgi:hypothetical protein
MIGDVTVVGLDTTTVVLDDICMDVPHRSVVTVPADRATVSKDLWRALSQRRLFQLHPGPITQAPVRALAPPAVTDEWQVKCRALEADNARLRARVTELEAARAVPAATEGSTGKLDEILALLRTRGVQGVALPSSSSSSSRAAAVVEVDVPAFIPAEIKPKDVEGRIAEVEAVTSEAASVGSAASALRKLRGKQ